jgi:hypothetical protein
LWLQQPGSGRKFNQQGHATRLRRRQLLHLALGAAALLGISRFACAEAYPTRPVTVIVPFAAGGASDVIARIVGEYLSRALGQQFVIENVAGAGGTTGTTRTMRASPDGYTIQLAKWVRTPPRWHSIRTSHTTRRLISSRSA